MKSGNKPDLSASLSPLLQRKVRELTDETVANGGAVPAAKMREVERLQRLAALVRDSTRPTRWRAMALLAATFLVAGVLLLLEVRPAEVELDLLVSTLAFSPQDRRQITGLMLLDELTASGFRETLPPAPVEGPELPAVRSPLLLRAASGGSGSITLSPVSASPDSRIALTSGPGPRFSLSLEGPETGVQATLSGNVELVWPESGRRVGRFGQGRALYLPASGRPLHLEGSVAPSARPELLPHLPARDLGFVRSFDEVVDGLRRPRTASSILSGSLYNETLNGREIRLRASNWLELPGARGEIRSLTRTEEGLHVRFHGWVDDIVLGHGPNRRSLLPSRLEWLGERHGLKLFWVSALWLFGVVAGVVRWWRNPAD